MRVDFYLLPGAGNDITHFLCRLLQKIYLQKLTCYLYVTAKEEEEKWDALLWTFNDISFLPHSIYQAGVENSPIYIGHTPPINNLDVLINLTEDTPTFCQQFQRIIEVVPPDENLRVLARKKYQYYQKENFELHTNQLARI